MRSRKNLIVILSLAGIMGSVLAVWDLKQSIGLCQRIYNMDTVGLEVATDLEDDLEDARRSLLDSLVIAEASSKAAALEEANASNDRVRDALAHLRTLDLPGSARLLDRFDRAWYTYRQAADEVARLSRQGDDAAAMKVEQTAGRFSFNSVLVSFRDLKQDLEEDASLDSAAVNQALRYSVFGVLEFVVSVGLILGALTKANRDRKQALAALQTTNSLLEAAKEVEHERAAILEIIGAHAPLNRSLPAIAELPRKCGVDAGVAIWVATEGGMRVQAAANLPERLTDSLRSYPVPAGDDTAAQLAELSRSLLAEQEGMRAIHPAPLYDVGGKVIGAVQVFGRQAEQDAIAPVASHLEHLASVAIENALLYERLAFQAQHDTLTELPNRLLFHDRLEQAIRAARRARKKLAVVWIDLDRYKQINDTLGHSVGDELLCEVARRLKGCLREMDSVARVGGDEFTVLITELASSSEVELVPEKISRTLSQPMLLAGHEVTITASMGVSLYPDHTEDPIALVRSADLAMYSAKQAGRNQYRVFQANLGAAAARRLEIERELKTALLRDEFTLVYQPLMNQDGKVDGLEALLRWNNPALGEVFPAEFIPIAEEVGAIIAIGEWVTRRACQEAGRWLRAGLEFGRVGVNVSAVQCVDKAFAPMVERTLKEFDLPPWKLELEVTETALIRNIDKAIVNIQYLRGLGVRFAIDDFGTGYSSLSQLQTLPIDCVKIDRSFVKDLEYEGNGCTTLVRGIIGLAHNLRLEVIAEGVETEEQLAVLQSLSCDVNQGFFLHKPMGAEAVANLLAATGPLEAERFTAAANGD